MANLTKTKFDSSRMQALFAFDGSGNLEYLGYGAKGLAEGTEGWLLYKFTWDASGNISSRKTAYGTWTGRATATYE